MSEKLFKAVRVEGERRLSLTDSCHEDYTDGKPAALCCAFTDAVAARAFAKSWSKPVLPPQITEVWEAVAESLEWAETRPYWAMKPQSVQPSARNLRLTRRVARYEDGKDVDCEPMSYPQEEKAEFCQNCGGSFLSHSTVKPWHEGFDQFTDTPHVMCAGEPKNLCKHCAGIYGTNTISRPARREDFKAKFVTREEHDAALVKEAQLWDELRKERNMLKAKNDALKTEVKRLHSVEQEVLSVREDRARVMQENTKLTRERDIECAHVESVLAANAKLHAANAEMLPLWKAVHFRFQTCTAASFRASATWHEGEGNDAWQQRDQDIAAALDPKADEPAEGKRAELPTCADCGMTTTHVEGGYYLAGTLRCPACAKKRRLKEQAEDNRTDNAYTGYVLKCPDCGEKSDSAVLTHGHPLCNACIAKREAEDAKRRLKERGERVLPYLKVGAPVRVNDILFHADGEKCSTYLANECGGKLATYVGPGSMDTVQIRFSDGCPHSFFPHNLTPWGADGPLPAFQEDAP